MGDCNTIFLMHQKNTHCICHINTFLARGGEEENNNNKKSTILKKEHTFFRQFKECSCNGVIYRRNKK